MPSIVTKYRVFIASPSGLDAIRQRFRDTLLAYNVDEALPVGVYFEPVGWEATLPGVGRPQALINEEIATCDRAIFVFRDRWGSRTVAAGDAGPASSGCHEEWLLCERMLAEQRMLSMQLCFLPVPEAQRRDPGEQLAKVLAFRQQIEDGRAHLIKDLRSDDEFEALVRSALGAWRREHEKRQARRPDGGMNLAAPAAMAEPPAQTAAADDGASRLLAVANALAAQRQWAAAAATADALLTGSGLAPALASKAMSVKAYALGMAGQTEAAATLYRELVQRFADAREPLVRAQVDEALVNLGVAQSGLGDEAAARLSFEQLLQRLPPLAEQTPLQQELAARALYNQAVLAGAAGRSLDSLALYDRLLADHETSPLPPLRELVARSLVNRGVRLGALDRPADELASYQRLLQRFGDSPEPALREQVAFALLNRGITLGRTAEAVQAYGELIRRFDGAPEETLRLEVARALLNRGIAQQELGLPQAALDDFDAVLQRFGDDPSPRLRERVVRAMAYRALVLGRLQGAPAEISAYQDLVLRFGHASELAVRERVAMALMDLGITASQALHDDRRALQAYDELIGRFGNATELALREQVARALVNKGVCLGRLQQPDDELACYAELVARFGTASEPQLLERVACGLVNQGITLDTLGRQDQALQAYAEVVERFGEHTQPAIAEQVARALNNHAAIGEELQRWASAVAASEQLIARFGDWTDATSRDAVDRAWARLTRIAWLVGEGRATMPDPPP